MTRISATKLLDEEIGLLVRHFGPENVRAAVARVAPQNGGATPTISPLRTSKRPAIPNVRSVLEDLRTTDPDRFQLLQEFRTSLRERRILPDAEDLRQFAQLAGQKELKGRSRGELISNLIVFLAAVSREILADAIAQAGGISAAKRDEGFSVLTDKLLRGT